MKIREECNKKLLCQMIAPIKLFTEPTDSVRVRDVDNSYEKALYRQFLMNPQNHLHRNPFIINILLNKQWQPLPEEQEEVEMIDNELQIIQQLAEENATLNSEKNTNTIKSKMTDLFANKLFECRYKLYVLGGNHSRSTYQRIICELENHDPDLLASIEETNTEPYVGITLISSKGIKVKYCFDSKIFFNLCMYFIYILFFIYQLNFL